MTTAKTITNENGKRIAMNRTLILVVAAVAGLGAGCDDFDPVSLITDTRVVGARVEVEGAPERATPAPGENATVTWLVTAPGPTPPLTWAFDLCLAAGNLGCAGPPLAIYEGIASPPSVVVAVPAMDALAGATSLVLFGRVCTGGAPTRDPQTGLPACMAGGDGTTVSVSIRLQLGGDANHNPVADRGLTFDGQPWAPLPAGSDPCAIGPRVSAGTEDHVLTVATAGADREAYTAITGDPPAPTAAREVLQLSSFVTSGELASPYAFIEADDPADAPAAVARWSSPSAADVAADTPVTFTFVLRDGRGGIDWTTRAACVTR